MQPGAAPGPASLRFVHHTVPVPRALRDPRSFTVSQRCCEAKLLLNKASGGGLRLYLEFSTCLPAPFPCCSSQRCGLCEPFWRAVCPLLSGETGQQVPVSTPKWQGLIWQNTQSLQSLLGALAQGLAHRSDPELGVCRGLGTWPQPWGGHAGHPAEARAEPEASTDFRTGLRPAENGTDAVCPEATGLQQHHLLVANSRSLFTALLPQPCSQPSQRQLQASLGHSHEGLPPPTPSGYETTLQTPNSRAQRAEGTHLSCVHPKTTRRIPTGFRQGASLAR